MPNTILADHQDAPSRVALAAVPVAVTTAYRNATGFDAPKSQWWRDSKHDAFVLDTGARKLAFGSMADGKEIDPRTRAEVIARVLSERDGKPMDPNHAGGAIAGGFSWTKAAVLVTAACALACTVMIGSTIGSYEDRSSTEHCCAFKIGVPGDAR